VFKIDTKEKGSRFMLEKEPINVKLISGSRRWSRRKRLKVRVISLFQEQTGTPLSSGESRPF